MKLADRILRGAILAAVTAGFAGCNQIIQYPKPTVSSLSPNTLQAGGAAFTLTVLGKDFVFGGQIVWNGTPFRTLYVNSGEMQAQVSPNFISAPGTVMVQVFNPPPGGGLSNTVNLTITPAPSPVPTITGLQPSAARAGGTAFFLVVEGTNFVPTSVVTWNGINLATTFVTNNDIEGSVTTTELESPGDVNVAVLNPAPGGGLSNTVSFPVDNPTPTVSLIFPVNSIAGGSGFTITVTGGGYTCAQFTTTTTTITCTTSSSTVEWNGTPLATTFVSSIELTATVSSSQLNQAGTNLVAVFNPSPGGGTSATSDFEVIPGPNGEGLPSLVDVSSSGVQANTGIGHPGHSGPTIGGGGRFIAFSSVSQNLVANLANAVANVFVRDTCLGIATGCTPQTALASVANNGQPTNSDALDPAISSDGRYVVFDSAATNLVSTVTPGATEVYLRDTCFGATSGCTPSTTLMSFAEDGVSAANGASTQPVLSPDDQYIVFVSTATDLVPGAVTGAPEIYLRSTCVGATTICTPTTTLVSVAAGGGMPADGISSAPMASSGGRYVAFESTATNLTGIPTAGSQQVYWRDTCTGVASGCTPTTTLVSVGSDSTMPGNGSSGEPAMTSEGRYVVFGSQATNLVGAGLPAGTPQQVYERDLCTGVASGCVPATTLVSVGSDGASPANAPAEFPQTDQSGRFVLYSTKASNLVTGPANGFEQVFARDTCLAAGPCTPRTKVVSVSAGGNIGNGDSLFPAIGTQAHFATFLSFADNLVNNDTTPTYEDIFLASTGF